MTHEAQILFDKYCVYSNERKISLMKRAYSDLKIGLEKAMGSDGAWFTAIRIACLLIGIDNNLSMDEYRLFKQFSDMNPNYEELYNTMMAVQRDVKGAMLKVFSNKETVFATYHLLMLLCAYKGYVSSSDEQILKYLLKD